MNDEKNKLIVITGPTASGKTALAIRLARRFHGEIISADSRQIYRGMDIGTAKYHDISPMIRGRRRGGRIPHHLINIRNPNQTYSLAHFQRDARKTIRSIRKRGHLPFLVGGTPLYINSIVNNLQIPEVKPNAGLRAKLEKLSVSKLFAMLKTKDPARSKTIDRHNKRRLIRALEIVHALGRVPPVNSLYRPGEGQGEVEPLIIGIKKSDITLRRAISNRTDAMFRAGLIREVQRLTVKYGRRKFFMDTIGYREVIEYLEGKLSLAEAKQQIKNHTWQFTRRQLTWFRRLPIIWIRSRAEAERLIPQFIRK